MTLLSILIPTIPQRKEQFTKLYNEVMAQVHMMYSIHESMGEVQVLVNGGERFLDGGLSIGKKRESLVLSAEGKYLCFLDDDDNIAPNYVESLMRLCLQGQDICTFRAMVKMQSFWALVDMRFIYTVNDQITPDYTVRRPPWHMCPVRSTYAKLFPFQDLNNAEDFEWMQKVLSCCASEAHTDKIIFQYNHSINSEADKIPLP